MANELINPVKVKKEMDAMIEMITHPAFVDAMKTMKQTPNSKRLALGKEVLSVQSLKSKGVKMPEGMRVTTRYFEPGTPEVLELRPDGKIKNIKVPSSPLGDFILKPGRLSWGGCACGGGLSFCGGAGASF